MKIVVKTLKKLLQKLDDLNKIICKHEFYELNYDSYHTYGCYICGKIDSKKGKK